MTRIYAHPRAQRGNALLSVAIGLVLVSIIVAGVIMWFSSSHKKTVISNLGQSVMQLQLNIEAAFMNKATYDGLDAQWVIDAGVLPRGLSVSTGTNIRHKLGGRVHVGPYTTWDSEFPDNSMTIALDGLDEEACLSLIRQIAPRHSDQIYSFRIADRNAGTGTSYVDGSPYPSVGQLTDDCGTVAEGSPRLRFYFRK